jgi:hypothetical protein
LVWAIWLTKREAKGALLVLNPLVCYQAWQAVVLGLAPLYISLTDIGGDAISLGNQHVDIEWVAYGHAIMAAGSCALYVGMKQFQPKEAVSEGAPLDSASALYLAVAVLLGSVFLIARETITQYAGSTVAQLSYLPTAVLCMVATNQRSSQQRSAKARFWILLAGGVWLFLLNARRASKEELILSFFPLIWWLIMTKRHTLLLVGGTVLAAFYLLVIAPLVASVRTDMSFLDETGATRVITEDGTARELTGLEENWRSDPGDYFHTWLNQTMQRMCEPVAAGLVASLADSGGFTFGSRLDYVPLTFIPRIFWRDKPATDLGTVFSEELGIRAPEGFKISSTGETSAGELYWNFGWPGTLLGMYVLGAALSGLWWRAVGTDPRRGLLEMTAYTGAMLSFVTGIGAFAGPLFIISVTAGVFWRVLIGLRWIFFKNRAISLRARRLSAA